ncbi:MAG: 6,7-dimethyl-8-ribityllumazine synthase [Pyrinomonadaceae bacterium]
MKIGLERSSVSARGFRFAIVVTRWNDLFTSKLADGAVEALKEADAVETFYVPGAFELPLACLKAAESAEFDAVIALGVVIRGDTPHFDYVAGQASAGIMQASMQSGVPVMFGVITADNVEQTEARCQQGADNKGYEAAVSAIEMAHLMREMKGRRNKV